ncbi:hypothetical protein CHS0354_003413 [Potamilus streckersoni]|uniref:Uncharacterized protein n=1 Tax=Potamilus streckersoni TaxID=2493646 RepID=A0AAE0SP07_9BIVA|nr:hypothetical protein CHS0354_003413 [Potamilus streckersoni]
MQLPLAVFIVSAYLCGICIATCPDGSFNGLVCGPFIPVRCPEGYSCFIPGGVSGLCCLDTAYRCAVGFPIGYGDRRGLFRCNGLTPNPQQCPSTHSCQPVEPTGNRPGICCPRRV